VILNKHTKEQNTYAVEHLCNDTDFQTFVSKQKSAPLEKQTPNTTEMISDEIPELDVVEIEKSLITIQQKVYPPLFEAKEIDLIVRYFRGSCIRMYGLIIKKPGYSLGFFIDNMLVPMYST
jgi:hypothetical protein